MPAALAQFGAVWNLHTGPGTLDPRLGEQQPLRRHAVILFPTNLFDGVCPGQGKAGCGHFCPHRTGQTQAQTDHAVATWARWARQKCWAINSAARAKPISSLMGVARIRLAPAAKPSARSHQLSLACR